MDISLVQVLEKLQAAKSVVITGHVHPDGDCLGSILALNRYLRHNNINSRMILDDDIPSHFGFLSDLNLIEKPKEQIEANLLVVLDASDRERIGKVNELVKAPILNIDHHISNNRFADFLYLDSAAAATGSILFELFQQAEFHPDELTATCLYTAIATDCGFFRYANTTASTMHYAASLLECGVKPVAISEALETKPAKGIFTLIRVLETLELVSSGKLAYITVSADILESEQSTDDYINYPRSIEGVEVAIMFKQVDPNLTRVSLRSRGIDVSAIALLFGGGGHKRAAGCTITGPFADAKQRMLATVDQALKEAK